MSDRDKFFDLVETELDYMTELGFDHEADKELSPADWVSLIVVQAGKALNDCTNSFDPQDFEKCMVSIAALARRANTYCKVNAGWGRRNKK